MKIIWYADDQTGRYDELIFDPFKKSRINVGRDNRNTIILSDNEVSRTHARFEFSKQGIYVIDLDSTNGVYLNDQRIDGDSPWRFGQSLRIGHYTFKLRDSEAVQPRPAKPKAAPRSAQKDTFPPKLFDQPIVSVQALRQNGLIDREMDYLALGGGIGSFVWIDHLRIFGIPAENIMAIGVESSPYGKYRRLCEYSQIPLHERLRSNAISTPDNIWGFPGYASRETWSEIKQGKLSGLKYIFQVFGEPTLAESYTPRAGDVFDSIDREARRIGWSHIYQPGRIMKVRKTDDGRFAVAFRIPSDQAQFSKRDRVVISRHLHIAMGYPGSQYLPDLQQFKQRHPESRCVVNAYEKHDEVYQQLKQKGGRVLIRGRGIVASRIIQRIHELRREGSDIQLLHLSRSRVEKGHKYDLANRHAEHDIEYQPFNWPKSCWGGTLRKRLEDASPEERLELMRQWGGTTTADRADWMDILSEGKASHWYLPYFGAIQSMELDGHRVVTTLASNQAFGEETRLSADFVIDCTGLVSDLQVNPVLKDLINIYGLERNAVSGKGAEQRLSGFKVTNNFEVAGLRNGNGRTYAAGVMTQNGPYAAVDSFLGLQYAALRAVDDLGKSAANNISPMGPISSFSGWLKWCSGSQP